MKIKISFVIITVLATFSACGKSAPEPGQQAKPAAAATLVPGAPEPSQAPTVAISDIVAAKTFQLRPPETLSAEQLPANEISEFIVTGKMGQYLRGEADEYDGPDSMLAAQVAGGGPVLKSEFADYCSDEQLYPLTQDGNVRMVYDPHGHKNTLHFSLIDKDDPLVSVGLKPEQVSINFGSFKRPTATEVVPHEHSCGVDETWPSVLVVESKAGWFRVARIEGYNKALPKNKSMQVLVASLKPGAKPVGAKDLPYTSSDDARTVMTARQQFITGNGWKGWRCIKGSSPDEDYPGGLAYIFEGITNDERFFIRMSGPISHAELKRLSTENIQDEESRKKQETTNRLLLEKTLATADPSSFKPNLSDLDAVISSLKLKQ
jgi:hypothetical protein